MSTTSIVVTFCILVGIAAAFVVRSRAHRPLTTAEIARLIKSIHSQTGVDPMKPQGFTLQPNGTWAPIQRGQPQK